MSEQPVQPPAPAEGAPAEHPGPITRLAERFMGHVEPVAADVKAMLLDHATTVSSFVGDLGALAKLIDPADAPAVAAVDALIAKALSATVSASNVALKARQAA